MEDVEVLRLVSDATGDAKARPSAPLAGNGDASEFSTQFHALIGQLFVNFMSESATHDLLLAELQSLSESSAALFRETLASQLAANGPLAAVEVLGGPAAPCAASAAGGLAGEFERLESDLDDALAKTRRSLRQQQQPHHLAPPTAALAPTSAAGATGLGTVPEFTAMDVGPERIVSSHSEHKRELSGHKVDSGLDLGAGLEGIAAGGPMRTPCVSTRAQSVGGTIDGPDVPVDSGARSKCSTATASETPKVTLPPLRSVGKLSALEVHEYFETSLHNALAIFLEKDEKEATDRYKEPVFRSGLGAPPASPIVIPAGTRLRALTYSNFVPVMHACSLPRYLALALFRKCLSATLALAGTNEATDGNAVAGADACPFDQEGRVAFDAFHTVWALLNEAFSDPVDICFGILAGDGRRRLRFDDFYNLVDDVLQCHPGLDFLQGLSVFRQLYSETVITRLFYEKANSATNEMTLAEWQKGKYVNMVRRLETNEDINAMRDVFSYKHFYVIYCKFWELDHDHDMIIDRDSICHYDGGSMLRTVTNRAAAGYGRRLWSKDPATWTYRDFIWFILSSEQKSHPSAIEYWFRCCDLDGDGVLSMYELLQIFDRQFDRMADQSKGDLIRRDDALCILLDMCKPAHGTYVTLSDLKRCCHTEHFFNFLFDMRQYENLTTRRHDPLFREWYDIVVAGRDGVFVKLEGWDRFAERAYDELAAIDTGSQTAAAAAAAADIPDDDDHAFQDDSTMDTDAVNESDADMGLASVGNVRAGAALDQAVLPMDPVEPAMDPLAALDDATLQRRSPPLAQSPQSPGPSPSPPRRNASWMPQLRIAVNSSGLLLGRSTSPLSPRHWHPLSTSPISPSPASPEGGPSREALQLGDAEAGDLDVEFPTRPRDTQ